MHHVSLSIFARNCRVRHIFRSTATILLASCALALTGAPPVAAAQDAKPAAMPTSPSPGKALICVYRLSKFIGNAKHDSLSVNGVPLATLHNGEYASIEVLPGSVTISGTPEMYYGGVIQSTAATVRNTTKKENERIRFDAEAGKTYYLRWTISSPEYSSIKVTPVDEATGAKEMSKLHPAKPPEDKDKEKQEQK
jgi:hypothetical protein